MTHREFKFKEPTEVNIESINSIKDGMGAGHVEVDKLVFTDTGALEVHDNSGGIIFAPGRWHEVCISEGPTITDKSIE